MEICHCHCSHLTRQRKNISHLNYCDIFLRGLLDSTLLPMVDYSCNISGIFFKTSQIISSVCLKSSNLIAKSQVLVTVPISLWLLILSFFPLLSNFLLCQPPCSSQDPFSPFPLQDFCTFLLLSAANIPLPIAIWFFPFLQFLQFSALVAPDMVSFATS